MVSGKNTTYRLIIFTVPAILFLVTLFAAGCNSEDAASLDTDGFAVQRNDMVDHQIINRGIFDKNVIDAMRKVPRHEFVDEGLQASAYADRPLPIGMGQTISQPYIVALMTENLKLAGNEIVLEIGTGSGYQAAVLAEIVNKVFTVEIIVSLHQKSNIVLSKYPGLATSNHDGYYGWEEYAPFDRIIVTAAPDHIPQPLVEQLKEGGIMILPVGPPGFNQVLWKVEKIDGEVISSRIIDNVAFVPLTREVK